MALERVTKLMHTWDVEKIIVPPSTEESEEVVVEQWRIEQFTRQGFSGEQITTLIYDGVNHHDTENLLAGGCDHATVISILGR
jgi:hypothetical protein